MSCYAKHPDIAGIECWHGPGHAGDHGKENRSWPNLADPLQVELLALRKVADAAEVIMATADHDPDDWGALSDLEDALKAAGR